MKIPKYMKIEPMPNCLKPALSYTVSIKRWGIPILIFKCMKERLELPWYYWLLYPYFCLKFLFTWKGEAVE